MNLENFEEHIHPAILGRGRDYYANGLVSAISTSDNFHYRAIVRGTESYQVKVTLNENTEIISSICSCPFDGGTVCKHETAVYYELIDLLEDPDKLNSSKVTDLRMVLDSLSKDQLLDIVMELADEDVAFHERLLFSYAPRNQQEVIYCKQFIRAVIQNYSGRSGFIGYREADRFADELYEVLNRIESVENAATAMEIAVLLLKETVRSLAFTDDSSGGIGSLLYETIAKMKEIAEETDDFSIQSEMQNQLLQISRSAVFDEWPDFRIDVLEICISFAHQTSLGNALLKELEHLSNNVQAGSYSDQQIHSIMLEVFEAQGRTNDSKKFLQDHLYHSSFRKKLMEQKMKEGNYNDVIELALEGEKQDEKHPGLITQWKQYRYEAYKQSGLLSEQKKLARELLAKGHFEYYEELKTWAAADFERFYERLKQQLATENLFMYTKLITVENDTDAIAAYVEKRPAEIESYADYLMDTHADVVIRLFAEKIRVSAEHSSNRSHYKDICRTLRRFEKIAGKDAQLELAEELKTAYKRRPAFVDELGKL